jgi:hypothetical protein
MFQAAIGVGLFATIASLFIGLRGGGLGAAIFLALALISLGVMAWAGRSYFALRRLRWRRELEQADTPLRQLFDHARAQAASAPAPPEDPDRAG